MDEADLECHGFETICKLSPCTLAVLAANGLVAAAC